MPKKYVPIETVLRWVRDLYSDFGMFRYKTDPQGNVTECSIGHMDSERKVYFVKGVSTKGDWQECVQQAKKLRSDQCLNQIQL